MSKILRVISINVPFQNQSVVHASLEGDRALFDFDVVVIRPSQFDSFGPGDLGTLRYLRSRMDAKRAELESFFLQGGVLVVFLDVPDFYRAVAGDWARQSVEAVNNYDFLDGNFAYSLQKGTGDQITYTDAAEPFVAVLKKSTVFWTAYIKIRPVPPPFNALRFFAYAGKAGAVAGKMPYQEGHIVILPNIQGLDEKTFFEACAEYRFKRQGTTPPDWTQDVLLPGLPPLQSRLAELDEQISEVRNARELLAQQVEERSAYRKLLYEKGKAQLEPIVLRALDDLEFGTTPGEIIQGTNFEIDGRTSQGSTPGIIEVKGSKKQIVQDEFAPFVTKILADWQVTSTPSKGVLVGNGLCEAPPNSRLGNKVFSPHVLDGAARHSVALVNSVELYWLCCALLRGDAVDKNAAREAILSSNGYVDLRPFLGESPFPAHGA